MTKKKPEQSSWNFSARRSPKEFQQGIKANVARAKANLGGATQELGYAEEVFGECDPYWSQFDSPDFAQHSPLTASAIEYLEQVYEQTERLVEITGQATLAEVRSLARTASSFGTITMTTSASFPGQLDSVISPGPRDDSTIAFNPKRVTEVIERRELHKDYARRFGAFDPELGDVYQGIWDALHRMEHVPERTALFLMRQAYDHLTRKLAPEDKVRSQPGWKSDISGKPKGVSRRQRLHFVADTHIKDQNARESLKSQISHFLAAHEELQRLHADKALDPELTRAALYEMQKIMEQIADAVGI